MLPAVGFLLATLICGALAAAVAGLVRELRGVPVSPARPRRRRQHARGGSVRLAAGLLVGLGVLVITRWPVATVAASALVVAWPKLFGGKRAEQRRIAYLEALVSFIESLRDSVASGASLEQALPMAASGSPEILRPGLARLVGQMRARMPLDDALAGLAAELDDASADLVLGALILNVRRRGDRLADVLAGLASASREELAMRRMVTAGREETRRGVQIVVAIMGGIVGFLILFGGDYVAAYDTAGGQLMLAVVAGVFAGGFMWLRALAQPPKTPALLVRPGEQTVGDETALLAGLLNQSADGPVTR